MKWAVQVDDREGREFEKLGHIKGIFSAPASMQAQYRPHAVASSPCFLRQARNVDFFFL